MPSSKLCLCGIAIISVLYDPYQIGVSQRLGRDDIRMEEFPQTLGNLTEASQMFEQIQGRNFVGYRDEAIRTVIARATAIERRCSAVLHNAAM